MPAWMWYALAAVQFGSVLGWLIVGGTLLAGLDRWSLVGILCLLFAVVNVLPWARIFDR